MNLDAEAAIREAIAQEIEAEAADSNVWNWSRAWRRGMYDAARIVREGGTP